MKTSLRKWRVDKGLTLTALAAGLGASKSMVSKWERNQTVPRRRYIHKIQEVTNGEVTADSFFQIEDAAA